MATVVMRNERLCYVSELVSSLRIAPCCLRPSQLSRFHPVSLHLDALFWLPQTYHPIVINTHGYSRVCHCYYFNTRMRVNEYLCTTHRTYGVTPPISTNLPTKREELVTESLMLELKKQNTFESEEEARTRYALTCFSFSNYIDPDRLFTLVTALFTGAPYPSRYYLDFYRGLALRLCKYFLMNTFDASGLWHRSLSLTYTWLLN